jgi:alkaline phosphatase D
MRRRVAVAAGAAALVGLGWRANRARLRRRGRAAFDRNPLQVALAPGATGPDHVRVWGRSPVAGPHELQILERSGGRLVARVPFDVPDDPATDGTWALSYPGDFADAPPLVPATAYRFSVCSLAGDRALDDGRWIGDGHFETAPRGNEDTPSRFAIAVMSCHLPFDEEGQSSPRASRLLELLPDVLERWNVKRVLMLGDQMYGDYPPNCSLFNADYFRPRAPNGQESVLDCSRQEVRRLYQERHRIFWKHPAYARLAASFPCHMILDDHEIVDNFGTAEEHSSARYKNLRDGALDAFYDYQGSRCLEPRGGERPSAFYQSFSYGTVAGFIMDLRSERHADADQIEVASPAQWKALTEFLTQERDKHVLFLALSVPLLHVPDWLATTGALLGEEDGDVADRWTNPKMHASRDRLFHLIREHQRENPEQKLVLLGGDVHVGAVSRFAWSDSTPDTYQLIASALSNTEGFMLRNLIELVPKIGAVIGHDGNADFSGELLAAPPENACEGEPANPYGKLNVGVIEIERHPDRQASSVRLVLLGCHDDGQPRTKIVFDSGRL